MSNFHVGQRIECIHQGDWGSPPYGEVMPGFGRIYIVRDAVLGPHGDPCVRLCEIKNAPARYLDGFRECMFTSECFRPVVERKTDTGMAILKKLLITTKQPVNV